jgi:hypothetical protein
MSSSEYPSERQKKAWLHNLLSNDKPRAEEEEQRRD